MDPQTYLKPRSPPPLTNATMELFLAAELKKLKYVPSRHHFISFFSQDGNKKSWDACGAVPCTRKVIEHPSIRVEADNNEELTLLKDFSFQEVTLLQMEHHNEKMCQKLAAFGFNSEILLAKAK